MAAAAWLPNLPIRGDPLTVDLAKNASTATRIAPGDVAYGGRLVKIRRGTGLRFAKAGDSTVSTRPPRRQQDGSAGPIVKIAENRLHVRADFDDYLFAYERVRQSVPPGGSMLNTRTKVSLQRAFTCSAWE